jgi:succinate dehydrogenase/fumarate reductase cytochrome b subunit
MGKPDIRMVLRVQRLSGLVFLCFLLVHLVNTSLAIFGPDTYNGYQRFARSIYQHALYEGLLLFTPLILHLSIGLWRIWKIRVPVSEMPLSRRLHRYSGVFLAIAVIGHVAATRGPSLIFGIYPEFEGLAFTFQWLPAYFYSYYAVFAGAALYHLWFGARSILKPRVAGLPALAFAGRALPIVAWVVIAASLLALGGQLFPVDDASDTEFAQLLLELWT